MEDYKYLKVFYNDKLVGTLAKTPDRLVAFEYDSDWLATGFSISPFSLPLQKKVFIDQIEIANRLNLPIVIHTREAIYDTLEILKTNECINKGVFHCCPLNVDLVREGLKLGFYISFAGPCTFKNSKNADEIIKMVPENRILIETDSPYLSPEPLRGTRNDSSNVKFIAEKIAKVKEVKVEEIAKITYNNAKKIFKI